MARYLLHCIDEITGQRVTLEYEVTRQSCGQKEYDVYRLIPTPPGVSLLHLRPLTTTDGAE